MKASSPAQACRVISSRQMPSSPRKKGALPQRNVLGGGGAIVAVGAQALRCDRKSSLSVASAADRCSTFAAMIHKLPTNGRRDSHRCPYTIPFP